MYTEQEEQPVVQSTEITEQVSENFTAEEMEHLKNFFDRLAKMAVTSFGDESEEVTDLEHYLLYRLKGIKRIFTKLQFSWDEYIPLLYQSFAQYIAGIEDNGARKQALQQSSEIMAVIFFLFQNRPFIDRASHLYDDQIRTLKEWIKENVSSAMAQK